MQNDLNTINDKKVNFETWVSVAQNIKCLENNTVPLPIS